MPSYRFDSLQTAFLERQARQRERISTLNTVQERHTDPKVTTYLNRFSYGVFGAGAMASQYNTFLSTFVTGVGVLTYSYEKRLEEVLGRVFGMETLYYTPPSSHPKAVGNHPEYTKNGIHKVAPEEEGEVPEYTHDLVLENGRGKSGFVWADQEDPTQIDFSTRFSHHRFEVDHSGRPQNPVGTIGLTGRGLLGKWGPNQAGDGIVLRRKEVTDGEPQTYQLLAIERKDTGEWAIPGGMIDVDKKESPFKAVIRELKEETGCDLEQEFTQNSIETYKGYVDDARNTQNAWVETEALSILCTKEVGEQITSTMQAADDPVNVAWIDLTPEDSRFTKLYANHKTMVEEAVRQHTGSTVS